MSSNKIQGVTSDLLPFWNTSVPKLKKNKFLHNSSSPICSYNVIPLPSASECNMSCSIEDGCSECRNNPQSMEKVPHVHWALLQLSHGALAVPNHADPSADDGYDTLVVTLKTREEQYLKLH
ncbi:uncharacterized protein EDB91DRAFT_1078117 [Suillus paluster]|uniref:uncharacterized protein n=1 Tax=Suillus paluster TaxID=48578 RepID=UPI001B886CEE|nr:uncharacterized protein EDB91DRAFT_1078117 [Suillus paluster]KAG1751303.1 hypothetical protein EDB91DRAFT_1078117 [Suillus paluster]